MSAAVCSWLVGSRWQLVPASRTLDRPGAASGGPARAACRPCFIATAFAASKIAIAARQCWCLRKRCKLRRVFRALPKQHRSATADWNDAWRPLARFEELVPNCRRSPHTSAALNSISSASRTGSTPLPTPSPLVFRLFCAPSLPAQAEPEQVSRVACALGQPHASQGEQPEQELCMRRRPLPTCLATQSGQGVGRLGRAGAGAVLQSVVQDQREGELPGSWGRSLRVWST